MIDAKVLLADLTRLLARLEDDLRERVFSPESETPELRQVLQAEWQAARDAERTAEAFESWAEQIITQAGVHWLLSCVFLRFIEDNGLVDRPWIGGTPQSGRLSLARDRHDQYFRENPHQNDRDYLLSCFREAGALPGLHTFFDEAHNPVFRLGISGDAAMGVMQFWQEVAADTGVLVRDFTDSDWNTRFLGDLYQELSEATRKRYALLQTPEFVEEFILDRTLTPAIHEFGYGDVRMIDPTCGSGHFLLGAFFRLVNEWSRAEPSRNSRDVAQQALNAVAGVDLNPFAVAIARFRLLLAALQVSQIHRMANAPDFVIHVAIGDSLLHGMRFGSSATQHLFDAAETHADTGLAHAYASEDLADVQRILGRQYHAVVGNPPYIVVKDSALNAAYRRQYASCHRQYSLGAPFTERFFELAVSTVDGRGAGYVGLITANSFMKREFGSKLIEQVLPRLDLTHVVDTSGAYIPGHGTPTVVLFGRHRPPVGDVVRTVMGIKGEPSAPDDPARGVVWNAILDQIDQVGSESEFLSVADIARTVFSTHPWSIGGGGVSDVKELLEADTNPLSSITTDLGFVCITKADDVFVIPRGAAIRQGCEASALKPFAIGEEVRDWAVNNENVCLFPYSDDVELLPPERLPGTLRFMWRCRTALYNRKVFGGQTYRQAGKEWYSYGQIPIERFKIQSAIVVAFVATHNHFALDRDGTVFKQSAPVIKLPAGSTESEHIGLLGLLNSSVACFWLKQVLHDKGNGGIGGGIASEDWERFYEFTSTALKDFPIPSRRPNDICSRLDQHALLLADLSPAHLIGRSELPTRSDLDRAREQASLVRQSMIFFQEELDWRCYKLYGLLSSDDQVEFAGTVHVALGERAFEIALARRVAAGQVRTTWFERHGSVPITEIPARWPEAYRRVVQQRINLIESDKAIRLLELPEFKRRWNSPDWKSMEQIALRDWLLARLESPTLWPASAEQLPQLTSTSRLADALQRDRNFMHMASMYTGRADFDPAELVAELVGAESVPFLPRLRFTEAGVRKYDQWEATWVLQRTEDRIDAEVTAELPSWREELSAIARQTYDRLDDPSASKWIEERLRERLARRQAERKANEVGEIPVPPKYQSKDFLRADFWRLRGGLDMPKERWISFPGCERSADGSLPIAWAGWNHLQQAMALATYFIDMKEREGWSRERLQPLLAGLLELVPWLKQWHNDMNPDFGARMGDYYETFVSEEARALQFMLDDLRAWKPAATVARRGRKAATA